MEVYLVRHGRTDGNVARRHQHHETKLNEEGKAQAKAAAERVAGLEPTYLIVSTYMRAIQSGAYIADMTGLIPETSSLFEELHQPATLIGERLKGLRAMNYMARWFIGYPSAAMHDGESYANFVRRIEQARTYLEALPEDSRVVVVSHSVFINFFTEHMIRPQRMNIFRAAVLSFKLLKMRNSSITHVRFTKPLNSTKTGWQLLWRIK